MRQCIDVESDIWSCGGCDGIDCTGLASVMDVSCVTGLCQVNSCEWGYELAENECILSEAVL